MGKVPSRHSKYVVAASVLLALPCSVQAGGYINDGNAWLAMPAQAKAAYIQGVSDSVNYVYINDDLNTAIVKVARTRCLLATKLTGVLLSDVITSAYTKNPALRVQPPIVVYVSRMAEICKPIINEERARMSLPPN